MDGRISSAVTVAQKRVGHELRQYALISVYLYVCFGALILYKMAILRGQGVGYAPYGLAAVKALILAKFFLLGRAARIGDRYENRRVIYVVAYKSLLFLVLLIGLSFIEEAVAGVVRGQTVVASLAEIGGGTLPQILATSLIVLLILFPYLLFSELNGILGEGKLRQILLERRSGSQSGGCRERQ